MIKVAILGYGVVGSGVYEILKNNARGITRKSSASIDVAYILDIRDFEDHPEKNIFTKNFDDILNDDELKIVIEVMGGLNPAYEFTKASLMAGKNVVTSNKELVATHGPELLELARKNNVNYMFEASVGGGIPIIRPMITCLAANNIKEIYGILNGTTNFILTKMFECGESFEDALSEAQRLGYAERNPEADVEGHDACRKIAILASLASGEYIDYKKILTEGITNITKADVLAAEKIGYVIKLIGYAKMEDGKTFARVSPMLVPKTCRLSEVSDVFNAILVNCDFLGEAMFYGRGAGKLPTASAVCADVIDCAKHINVNRTVVFGNMADENIISAGDTCSRYFVRTKDASLISEFDGAERIDCATDEIIFVTKPTLEKEFIKKTDGKCQYIRMMD